MSLFYIIMGLFSKTAMDYIVQIIDVANKTKSSVLKKDIESSKRLLNLILNFNEKEFYLIKEETGSQELLNECRLIHSLSKEALEDIEKGHLEKTLVIIDKIIKLESQDILLKVKKYHEIKKELKKRKSDIDKIADSLGFGIDKLIKPLVATLMYLGFKTEQSCHGHMDRGEKHPWVRLQANNNFNELLRVIQKYNLNNTVRWTFNKLANSSTFTSSIGIFRPDRNELSKVELNFILSFCEKEIKEKKFDLKCGNMKNFWIVIVSKNGTHSDDLKTLYSLIKTPLLKEGYEVSMDIPKDLKEPDSYNLFAEGRSLKMMQQDIIHFSDFIINNYDVFK